MERLKRLSSSRFLFLLLTLTGRTNSAINGESFTNSDDGKIFSATFISSSGQPTNMPKSSFTDMYVWPATLFQD